jgi:acetylglutamate/LysW-gamma-L-alpha-aminoadipate kinase
MDLAQGRMKKKLMGASEALAGGVGRVILGDARLEHPIQQALEGRGTVLR